MSTILIVEDEELAQRVLALILRHTGFDIIFAADGVQALEKIEEKTPDLIVTDIGMPRMDGGEMIRRIKENSAFTSIPVIVTSALPLDRSLEKLVDAYIAKPIPIHELNTLIQKVLESDRGSA